MSDYLRSALGYLNGTSNSNDYIGQVVEINNVKLRVNRLIAEGGWALVFAVEDVNTGKEYALKKLVAVDEEANKTILQEIEYLKALSGHSNIIQFLCVHRVEREARKSYEYLLVTEYCPGGTIADILRNVTGNALTVAQVCRIAYQATKAVHHMHNQQPQPIVHRDIKLENFLIGSDGLVKLCDFGSATTQQILPDSSWNAQKRATLEDQMAKYTTPMYRAPEMTDTWNNEPIGPPVDCWALGCILYALVTLRLPFPEGNKLAVINAKYAPLPPNPRFACFHDLIKGCLQISPVQRLTTSVLLERLAAIAESNNFDPREPAKIDVVIKPPAPPRPSPPPPVAAAAPPRPSPAAAPPPRPAPVAPAPCFKAPMAQSTGLFSSLKGGAGSILRNLKDTSSKVMHTVQQSMARTELDASYLTSRILVMPYPADGIESAYRANHVEDVRAFLQARHPPPAKIQLYNLSRGRPNVSRLPGRHIDCSFAYASVDSNAPLLSAIYQICQDIYRYLDADFHHVVVLYCTDGFRASATVALSLVLYSRTLSSTEEAISLFITRRCQPPQLQPSELRIVNYMSFLSNSKLPHAKPLVLRSLLIQPVPLFTRARDGCRPYVEIYSNGALVFSTKRAEYEEMKLYSMMEGKVCLILGEATVRGDITVILFHARQQLGRVIGIKIAAMHFHTGYVPLTESTFAFEKQDLDDTPEICGNFRVILNVTIGEESGKTARVPSPWEVDTSPKPVPDPLFGSTLEMEETLDNFRSTTPRQEVPEETPLVAESETSEEKSSSREETPQEELTEDELKEEEAKFAEADLLNLGMPESSTNLISNTSNTPSAPVNPGLDIFSSSSQNESDLLGGFGEFHQHTPNPPPNIGEPLSNDLLFGTIQPSTNGSSAHNVNVNDLLFGKSQPPPAPKNVDIIFDPLGKIGVSNLLGGWANSNASAPKTNSEDSFPRNSSVPNFAAQSKDPFANLAGSMGAGLAGSWNGTPKEGNTPQSASPAASGTPVHSSPRMHKSNTSNDNATAAAAAAAAAADPANSKPAKSGDAFEDLLGSQGYNFFSTRKADKESPKTINQMRKVEAAKTMDPDRLKITEWTEGKKSNLRALLCSMHTIIWEDCRWQKCEIHQLVSPADVKRAYRKACLAVHPDKQSGTDNENIAKLIFMELNNAWTAFENDASQQNIFS